MWFGISSISNWLDPQKCGDKYQSITNHEYILEYLRNDGAAENPVFVFKASTGVDISLDRATLERYYRRWVDPYASQKAYAKSNGFTWKDSQEPAVFCNVVTY